MKNNSITGNVGLEKKFFMNLRNNLVPVPLLLKQFGDGAIIVQKCNRGMVLRPTTTVIICMFA